MGMKFYGEPGQGKILTFDPDGPDQVEDNPPRILGDDFYMTLIDYLRLVAGLPRKYKYKLIKFVDEAEQLLQNLQKPE